MWKFASRCLVGTGGFPLKNGLNKQTRHVQESSAISKDDGLECPICCESFNLVDNVPYVLWCGHSLCKNCVLNLQWAVVKIKINPLPVQLPLLVSCPWCYLLSPRIVLKGKLKLPRKNYFLLWMVERINTDKAKSHTNETCDDCQVAKLTSTSQPKPSDLQRSPSFGPTTSYYRVIRISYLQRSFFFVVELTTKFPLVLIFLLLVIYAIPASALILAVYVVLTIVFALPSFLVLYFSYPNLDWLLREIMA